jgi:hypothetical protein
LFRTWELHNVRHSLTPRRIPVQILAAGVRAWA